MKKVKTLRVLVLLLVLINLSFLAFHFFVAKPHRGGKGGPNIKEMVSKDLHFDANQKKAYEKLIVIHQKAIIKLEKEKVKTKKALYLLLDEKKEDNKKQQELLHYLGNLQIEIEGTNFNHFEDIYKLCKPDQQKYFKKLQHKLVRLFDHKVPPKPKK